MNNYHTLIYQTRHLKNKFEQTRFLFSISPHKNVWEGYFSPENSDPIRLIFSTSPGEIAIFSAPYRTPKKSNVLRFFDSLNGQQVVRVALADGDRWITFQFEGGRDLRFRLFSSKANVLETDGTIITDAFKNPDRLTGSKPPEPRPAGGQTPEPSKDLTAKQSILHTDPAFPRPLIPAVIRHYELDGKSPEEVAEIVRGLLQTMRNNPEFRLLRDGNFCLFPQSALPAETEKHFSQINDAVTHIYYNRSHHRRFYNRWKTLRDAVQDELSKSAKRLEQLEDGEKALQRAEVYEQTGHLLMANAHTDIPDGSETMEVTNFYKDNRTERVRVKPELTIAENAQRYYEKSAKAKKRVQANRKREREIRKEVPRLKELLDELQEIRKLYELEEWEKNRAEELQQLGLLKKREQKRSLPYRRIDVDGYEVWIGKSAKSNDELTSRAHKEDIWLHARGVPGSHTVIRMENDTGYPQRNTVLKVASHAAWHSSARTSTLVPVMITKRKYVTKPKGAPAGSVRVQQESVEMVRPEPT